MKKNPSNDPRIKEAYLYRTLSNNAVQCLTCNRFCKLEENELGYCKTRKNSAGKLYTLIYGDISSYSINPIEKKPAYHFYPGSFALTLGSWGCNFPCLWCQNFEISKRLPPEHPSDSIIQLPKEISEKLKFLENVQGVSLSFNEPTLSLEFALDLFNSIDETHYKQFVTNGYMSLEALQLLIKAGLNCMTVSIKGSKDLLKGSFKINTDLIWKNLNFAHKKGVHIELVYLMVTDFNTSTEYISEFLEKASSYLDLSVPVHFTRYFPAYLYDKPPTPIKLLEQAYHMAKSFGFEYVYLGNVPNHPYENTYCPQCNKLLIKRSSFSIITNNLKDNTICPNCGYAIKIKIDEKP